MIARNSERAIEQHRHAVPVAGRNNRAGERLAFEPAPAAPPGVKETVTLRIDRDVLDFFQQDGPGWQDRINAALRKAAGK